MGEITLASLIKEAFQLAPVSTSFIFIVLAFALYGVYALIRKLF